MTGLDERKKAQEQKFAQDGENTFKINARRRKMLGLWASEKTGMNEIDSLEYAMDIVKFGVDHDDFTKVSEKIIADSKKRGVEIDLEELSKKNAEFAAIARKQIIDQ